MTSHEESVYEGLLVNDAHWAFGTSFEDPLAGVDTTVPPGVDARELAAYCLGLGDDALVLSQRLAEWCSRAPDLEDDIALSNIALDLLGQARFLLTRAAAADPTLVPTMPQGSPVPAEDALAYFRDASQFRNVILAELERGDFAEVVARVRLFATHRLSLFEVLVDHPDPVLAAVAAKSCKELRYHQEYAARWCETLSHGTEESIARMQRATEVLAPHVAELIDPEIGPGRRGVHTPALTDLLTELQSVARAHPMGLW